VADNFADFFGSVITVTNTVGATNHTHRASTACVWCRRHRIRWRLSVAPKHLPARPADERTEWAERQLAGSGAYGGARSLGA
jgi:lauroyl/myristoyl acyltransferase